MDIQFSLNYFLNSSSVLGIQNAVFVANNILSLILSACIKLFQVEPFEQFLLPMLSFSL